MNHICTTIYEPSMNHLWTIYEPSTSISQGLGKTSKTPGLPGVSSESSDSPGTEKLIWWRSSSTPSLWETWENHRSMAGKCWNVWWHQRVEREWMIIIDNLISDSKSNSRTGKEWVCSKPQHRWHLVRPNVQILRRWWDSSSLGANPVIDP